MTTFVSRTALAAALSILAAGGFARAGLDPIFVSRHDDGAAKAVHFVPDRAPPGPDESGWVARPEQAFVKVPGGPVAASDKTGPCITPEWGLGERLKLGPGELREIGYELHAPNGLKLAVLIGPEGPIETMTFHGETEGKARFAVPLDAPWVAITVEDVDGEMAFSVPVWIERMAAADLLAID